ncbi:MAG: hypothetical protein FJ267_16190, partial [Planctomycetes bacterium]|nr:hypothetical protein [Planctomycetota bacterium]
QSAPDIGQRYTFFSHVGNALALWRRTHPADFWRTWESSHPVLDEDSDQARDSQSNNDSSEESGSESPGVESQ